MKRTYSSQEKNVILNFYKAGIGISCLSRNFKIPDSTIATWVRKNRDGGGDTPIDETEQEKAKIISAEKFITDNLDVVNNEFIDEDPLFTGYKEGYRDGLKEVFRYLKTKEIL